MLRIAANARRLQRQHDIKLVVIDYLQLIEPDNRRDPRQEQVAQISRRLKFLARELEIPVDRAGPGEPLVGGPAGPPAAAVGFAGKSVASSRTRTPSCMLHRPDRYEPGQHEGVIEIIIAKQRNGPTGEVTLAYIKQHMRYEDFKVGTPFDG